MKILEFCRQKTASWEGVIFQGDDGKVYITNGLAVWDDSEKRRASLEKMEHIDLGLVCERLRSYQLNHTLLEMLQALGGTQDPVDRDYLARPLLKELTYEISAEKGIKISSSGGIVAQAAAPSPLLNKKALLEQYQRVLTTAKSRRACICYVNHLRRTITKEWKDYLAVAKERRDLFEKLLDQAHLLQMRGIHMGYRDDAQLKKWNELCQRYEYIGRRNSPVTRMGYAADSLSEWEQEFQANPTLGGRACKVYL